MSVIDYILNSKNGMELKCSYCKNISRYKKIDIIDIKNIWMIDEEDGLEHDYTLKCCHCNKIMYHSHYYPIWR